MIAVAVNCLVKEAKRKFVFASIGRKVRRSVTPYPRRNTGCPSRTTRTAAPGAWLDLREEKMASTWVDETCADARIEKKANVTVTSDVFNPVFPAPSRT